VLTADTAEAGTSAAHALLSAAAVRERAAEMWDIGLSGRLPNFQIDQAKFEPAAAFVAGVIRDNYPDLKVPLHARWRHFVLGGKDLWAEIAGRTQWPSQSTKARAEFDLAIVSVLLDAGAGPHWRYRDTATGFTIGRSEGLALASLRMFEAGLFSADPRDPLRADASKLASLTANDLAKGFQSSAGNSLAGLEGRAALLARLGRNAAARPAIFGAEDTPRPGGLFDSVAAGGGTIAAPHLLKAVLTQLGPIWPSRLTLGDVALGDTWRHSAIRRADATDGLVPLHKLSQWLTYSLIEPLEDAGIAVADIDGLTGLAEYRNGGLFIDLDLLTPRDPDLAKIPLTVDSEPVVEWRALTVALLDRIAPLVKNQLGIAHDAIPLGSILEGGTWAAGRKAAKSKRPDGGPPLTIVSDGTVF
jgi:hypothetical protein